MEFKTLYESVVALLEKTPHLRDSDEKLAATIWLKELGGKEVAERMTGMDLLTRFAANSELHTLSSLESIGRARRKAQENRSELRGAKYYSRQHKQEEWKEVLRNQTR